MKTLSQVAVLDILAEIAFFKGPGPDDGHVFWTSILAAETAAIWFKLLWGLALGSWPTSSDLKLGSWFVANTEARG